MDHKQKLTFVLLCSGNGADSSTYRPNSDDKRYRHRQDALVRCVAVTLFSAAGASTITDDGRSCELILLYDGDLSCIMMSLTSKSSEDKVPAFTQQPPPLERDIVSAWKNASNEATRRQHSSSLGTIGSFTRNRNGCDSSAASLFQLHTECVLDCPPSQTAEVSNFKKSNNLPSHIMPASKRDAINMLQSTCSLEFLRSHHLNVPLAVALKKFNKNKLQAVWDDAKKHGDSSSDTNTQQSDCSRIETIFHNILSKGNDPTNDYSTDVLAAYLHESCDSELPCWSKELYVRNKEVKNIFLFCGAVRDMTDAENNSLFNVCKQMKIPLMPCRLGPVPEFTSKIVSVAGYHFYKGLLGSGLIKLWEQKQSSHKQPQEMMNTSQPLSNNISHKRSLHTIAIIPIDSTSLTADPSKRCRVHWCMVRLCVCSLYRSKFASTTREALCNTLSFIFQDGKAINLDQRGFISSLAEKHQAAPSERQILEELCRRRDNTLSQEERTDDDVNHLISSYTPKNGYQGDVYALDFTDELHRTSKQVMELAYAEDSPSGNSGDSSLLAILQVRDQSGHVNTKMKRMHKRILEAITRSNFQVMAQSPLVSEAQDDEALTVIMLQHLDYQAKLSGILRQVFKTSPSEAIASDVATTKESGRKRKKKQKDEKKKKKSKKKQHHKHPQKS